MIDLSVELRLPSYQSGYIRRTDRDHGFVSLEFPAFVIYGDVDMYKLVKNAKGTWDPWKKTWTVKRSSADRICQRAAAAGANIVTTDDPAPIPAGFLFTIQVQPVVTESGTHVGVHEELDLAEVKRGLAGVSDRRAVVPLVQRVGAHWDVHSAGTTVRRFARLKPVPAPQNSDHIRYTIIAPLVLPDRSGTAVATHDAFGFEVSLEVAWDDPTDPRVCETERMVAGWAWTSQRKNLERAGVVVNEIFPPAPPEVDWAGVPGGELPVNGRQLRHYQREGVEFLHRHGLNALLADEMGTGKTAQVVAAVGIAGTRRNLVICPKAAVPVWCREIRAWSPGAPEVVVISSATDVPALPAAGWVIVTFDTVTPRTEVVQIGGYIANELDRVAAGFDAVGAGEVLGRDAKTLTLRLVPEKPALLDAVEAALPRTPEWFRDHQRIRDALSRVRGAVIRELEAWNPEWCGVDEAHRIKNPKTTRTKVVRRLLQGRAGTLVTGTPLRNRVSEGLELLKALGLDGSPYAEAAATYGYRESRLLQLLLGRFMIRRTKTEVNPELPPKIYQRIDIKSGVNAAQYVVEYLDAMEKAQEFYERELFRSGNMAKAAEAALGMWSKARKFLGLAKVADGVVADLVADVVEERGCCIAFAHHRDVIAMLNKQLAEFGLRVGVITGNTSIADRVEVERAFQEGDLDVFLGGLTAAGESINLTRSDTCVNAELDWVPAAMSQAEDRGHRTGQTANGYHILTCLADFGLPQDLDMDAIMWSCLGRKTREIKEFLGEGTTLTDTPESTNVREILKAQAHARALARAEAEGRELPAPKLAVKAKLAATPTDPSAPDDIEAQIREEYRRIDAAVARGDLEKRLAPARKAHFSRRLRLGQAVTLTPTSKPRVRVPAGRRVT